jgi:hypothetical protein
MPMLNKFHIVNLLMAGSRNVTSGTDTKNSKVTHPGVFEYPIRVSDREVHMLQPAEWNYNGKLRVF